MPFDPRPHLSQSQFSDYAKCSLAYKLKRIDKLPDPPSAALVKGNAVHTALEEWEKSDRVLDAIEVYKNDWQVQLDKSLERFPDLADWSHSRRTRSAETDLKYRYEDGLTEVKNYCDIAHEGAGEWSVMRLANGQVAAELPFTLDFDEFVVRGYIDVVQVFGDLDTVADYKTGSAAEESYLQLGTYRLGLLEGYGVDVQFGRYIYTQATKDHPRGQTSNWIDLSRYTKPYLKEQYATLLRGIQNEVFLPVAGKGKCQTCSMKQYCPEMSGR